MSSSIFRRLGVSTVSALAALQVSAAVAGPQPCDKIDKTKTDFDGMPYCPAVVEQTSAFGVFRCAISQARSYHTPTQVEKNTMLAMLKAFKQSKLQGISKDTTSSIMTNASALGLQACRVKKTSAAGNPDSYLLIYTRPGVQDYSGPLLMLRETASSKVIIVGPHDDSDGTHTATKLGLSESQALATISNGHRRGTVATGDFRQTGGDFVHTTNNLGTYTVEAIGKLFPGSVWLHAHGMAIPDRVLDRSRSSVLQTAFEAAIAKFSRIDEGDFGRLNAYFTIDPLVNSNFYLKTEIPAVIYRNNPRVLASVVREIEKKSFSWGSSDSIPDTVPADDADEGVSVDDGSSESDEDLDE